MTARVATVIAIALLAGCGSSPDRFHPIDQGAVAIKFQDPVTTTTSTTLPRPSTTTSAATTTAATPTTPLPTTTPPTTVPSEDVFLYFVTADNVHLRVVKQRRALPIMPIDVLKDLQTAAKPDPALHSLIAPGLVTDVKVDRAAEVTLAADFEARTPEEQKLIGAQLTLTLTQLRGISLVRFVVDGEAVFIPMDSDRVDQYRGQSDYSALVVK